MEFYDGSLLLFHMSVHQDSIVLQLHPLKQSHTQHKHQVLFSLHSFAAVIQRFGMHI